MRADSKLSFNNNGNEKVAQEIEVIQAPRKPMNYTSKPEVSMDSSAISPQKNSASPRRSYQQQHKRPSPETKKASLKTYLTQKKEPSPPKVEDVDNANRRNRGSLSRDNSRGRILLGQESSEYKKKIDSVRHRVDCWNRSASLNNTSEFTPMRKDNQSFG